MVALLCSWSTMKCLVTTTLVLSFFMQIVAARAINRAIASPVKNTGKRGLGYNDPAYTLPFSLSGQNSQVSWSYNWGQTAGSGANPALDYVPMLWSNNSDLTSAWPAHAQAAISSGSTALLGFNEPDLCQGGSSCMDVQTSVTAWKRYMEPFAGKALLGSPAVTNAGPPDGLTWLQDFLNTCTGCHIDFINIHWYSNKWAGASYFKSQVQAAHAMSGGRPVWITEFGLDDSDGTYTTADLDAFLQEILPWLDAQGYVHRYAYFMDTPGMLLNADGTGMSDTGVLYNSYPQTGTSSASSNGSSSSTASKTTISVSPQTSLSTSARISTTRSSTSAASSAASLSSTSSTAASPATRSSTSSVSSTSKTTVGTSYTTFATRLSSTSFSSTTKPVSSSSITVSAAKPTAQTVVSATKTTLSSSTAVSSSKPAIASVSSTMLPVASAKSTTSPVSPGIQILSAFYADKDVTTAATTAFSQAGNLIIDTSALTSTLSVADPWSGTVKTISVLYSYNGSTHIFSTVEKTGTYTITPSNISSSSQTPSIAKTRGASIDIVGIVWGTMQVKTPSVFDSIDSQQATHWGFQISTGLFGVDGLWGTAKVGIVWYRDASGDLKSLVSKEDGWVKF